MDGSMHGCSRRRRQEGWKEVIGKCSFLFCTIVVVVVVRVMIVAIVLVVVFVVVLVVQVVGCVRQCVCLCVWGSSVCLCVWGSSVFVLVVPFLPFANYFHVNGAQTTIIPTNKRQQ